MPGALAGSRDATGPGEIEQQQPVPPQGPRRALEDPIEGAVVVAAVERVAEDLADGEDRVAALWQAGVDERAELDDARWGVEAGEHLPGAGDRNRREARGVDGGQLLAVARHHTAMLSGRDA